MYCKLNLLDSATQQEVLADVVSILTGETEVNNLVSVDVIDTFIDVSANAAGWELWDDVSDDVKVLRSAIADDPTQFKYIHFSIESLLRIGWRFYRSWDNAAHTGEELRRRNPRGDYGADAYLTYSALSNTIVRLSSSARHFASYGNQSNTGMHMVCEHERVHGWDTVENGFIPVVYTTAPVTATWTNASASSTWGYTYLFSKPTYPLARSYGEIQDINAGDHANCGLVHQTPVGCGKCVTGASTATVNYSVAVSESSMDSEKASKHNIVPFVLSNSEITVGDISHICGIYLTLGGVDDDQYVLDGKTYVFWGTPGFNHAILKG